MSCSNACGRPRKFERSFELPIMSDIADWVDDACWTLKFEPCGDSMAGVSRLFGLLSNVADSQVWRDNESGQLDALLNQIICAVVEIAWSDAECRPLDEALGYIRGFTLSNEYFPDEFSYKPEIIPGWCFTSISERVSHLCQLLVVCGESHAAEFGKNYAMGVIVHCAVWQMYNNDSSGSSHRGACCCCRCCACSGNN